MYDGSEAVFERGLYNIQKFASHSHQCLSRYGAVIDVTVKHLALIKIFLVGQSTESMVELELKYVSHEVSGERDAF